ncbi:unknown protein [Seminavis robusta]|uniref:Uncharacterized protein n=1 Tax=Seminavis robusta TaxID=568900 RepID=A0A9N8EZZ1_9STRA|nr:unknown protein [Seminavis robusta]|eukprot:Sro2289_g322120.1 n/a (505) ;mRNA; r:2183-3697
MTFVPPTYQLSAVHEHASHIGTGLVTAELVPEAEPVEALHVAHIPTTTSDGTQDQIRQLQQRLSSTVIDSETRQQIEQLQRQLDVSINNNHSSHDGGKPPKAVIATKWWRLGLFLVLISLLVAVVVVLGTVLGRGAANDDDPEMTPSAPATTPINATDTSSSMIDPPSSPTTTQHDYDCYTSTMDVLQAQLFQPEQQLFIMCPQSRIKIGELDTPEQASVRFINGDYPLVIVRANVEVRCGLSGAVDNDCILEGGQTQVAMLHDLYQNELGISSSPATHNVTLRGITFTGALVSDLLWGSASVTIGNPGRNIRLINCKWENMFAPTGLIYVGLDTFQQAYGTASLPSRSSEVAIINSTFTNITYDAALIRVFDQDVSVQGCQFDNIKVTNYARPCYHEFGQDWCHGLMYCYGGSFCGLSDICVDQFNFFGHASLLAASSKTEWSISGARYTHGVELHSQPMAAVEGPICESGVGQYDESFETVECLPVEQGGRLWTHMSQCPLH